ncbi:DUF2892 domain-containing protein [Luminiphilus sp.]|jgi:hypothetical protein|nr:DUF2892 domain-containing protein [Luminiphilus sp.]
MKKNLGPFERLIRLALGSASLFFVFIQPEWGVTEGIVAIVGLFLLLNALSARCYLWRWLGIDTRASAQCDFSQASDRAAD